MEAGKSYYVGIKVVLRKVSGCDKRTQKPARGSPWITQGASEQQNKQWQL